MLLVLVPLGLKQTHTKIEWELTAFVETKYSDFWVSFSCLFAIFYVSQSNSDLYDWHLSNGTAAAREPSSSIVGQF